jgi:ABC-type phosphate/phosphonate transport system substrate-binding protein
MSEMNWGDSMKGKGLITAACAVALLAVLGARGWSESRSLSFGVIIWRSPTLTAQFWNPILRYVSERSGVPLQLKVAPTGTDHSAMVRRGELDFLYSNHNFIKENSASGYRVFARTEGDAERGEIVVLETSPIQALADLEGQEMVFPHAAAFLGYHLPMDALLRKGIHVKSHFAGNQEGAMGQLKAGRAVAAGVNAEVMKAFAKREMANDPEGRKVLASSAALLQQTSPLRFIAAKDAEFDNMRRFYRTALVKVELQ